MPACSTGTFEGARLKGLVVCDGDATPLRGSVEYVLLPQNPEPRPGSPGARILPLSKGVRKHNAAAALGPSASHHARISDSCSLQAGCQPQVTSRPDPEPLPLPHDDRAVIEIQILTRSCKPSPIRMPGSIQKLANKRCSPSRKPGMRTTSSGVSTTGKAPRR